MPLFFTTTLILACLCCHISAACEGIDFRNPFDEYVKEYSVDVIENAVPGIIALTIISSCYGPDPHPILYSIDDGPPGFCIVNNTLQTADEPGLKLPVDDYTLIISATAGNITANIPVHITICSAAEANLTFTSTDQQLDIFVGVPVGTLVWTVNYPDVYLQLINDEWDKYFLLSQDNRSLLVLRTFRYVEKEYFVFTLLSVTPTRINNLDLEVRIWPATAPVIHGAICTKTHITICWLGTKFGQVAGYQIEVTYAGQIEQLPMTQVVESGDLLCARLEVAISESVSIVVAAVRFAVDGVGLGEPSDAIELTPSQCVSSVCGCMNGGSCIRQDSDTSSMVIEEGGVDDDDDYVCECLPEYTGKYCERRVQDGCELIRCQNGGTCFETDSGTMCECPPMFTGTFCGSNLEVCSPQYCLNDGECVFDEGTVHCYCLPGHGGTRCETVAQCPSVREIRLTGVITWNATRFNSAAKIHCAMGVLSPLEKGSPIPYAYKQCDLVNDRDPTWRASNFSHCPQGVASPEIAGDVLDAIADGEFLSASDENLLFLQELLGNLIDIAASDIDLSYRYFKAADVLADPAYTDTPHVTEKLMTNIETFMGKMDMVVNEIFNATFSNIEVEVSRVPRQSLDQGLAFQGQQTTHTHVASISLPPEVFEQSDHSDFLVKFGLIKNVKLFPASSAANKSVYEVGVLVATVDNLHVQNLATCIKYGFPITQKNEAYNYECVFLDKRSNTWSSSGIERHRLDEYYIECCSRHLTNFAILLDVDPGVKVSVEHQTAMSIISYIGVSLAIIGLCLTIVTYALFPCLRNDKAGQILLNLCLAMLLMDCFFLAGVERQNVVNDDACAAVAAILHYSLLATMTWMSIEAFHLYRLLIKVFEVYENYFLIKRAIIAWGVPLLLVVISMAVDIHNYKHPDNESCFISANNPGLYYGTLIAPVCLALVFNIIVFALVLRVVLKQKFDHSNDKRTVNATQIRGILSVMTLLGISWLFGTLAIGPVKTAFQYIFIISTSLQGFCIFIFRCFCNADAKASWLQLFREGTLKRRRGPAAKILSSSNTPSGHPLSNNTRQNSGDGGRLSNTASTIVGFSDIEKHVDQGEKSVDQEGEGAGEYAQITDHIHDEKSIYSVPNGDAVNTGSMYCVDGVTGEGVTASSEAPKCVKSDVAHKYWLNKYQ